MPNSSIGPTLADLQHFAIKGLCGLTVFVGHMFSCSKFDPGNRASSTCLEMSHPTSTEPSSILTPGLLRWLDPIPDAEQGNMVPVLSPVSYTHLRAHETDSYLV